MDWYVRRQTLDRNTLGLLVSPIAAKIQHLIQDHGRRYQFHSSDETFFEVISSETRNEYLVNLHDQTCSCYGWQKQGYPCGHALAIIMSRKQDPQTFAKPFFTLQAYRSTYETAIMHPLTGKYSLPLQLSDTANHEIDEESDFDEDIILPPNTRRPTGRPKKRRIRSVSENDENSAPKRSHRCSRCKAMGHSRRTCREAI